jgi:hypothetical protein
VRDNVVFELGLFVGGIGRDRTFIVVPDNTPDLRLPSDLAGVTVGTYETSRTDKKLRAALGPFCAEVREEINRRGIRKVPKRSVSAPLREVGVNEEIQRALSRVSVRLREAMNPEPLERLQSLNSWFRVQVHQYFENRLWPESLDRAQRDVSGISHRDPVMAVRIDARHKARRAAARYGLEVYWDEWAAEHLK